MGRKLATLAMVILCFGSTYAQVTYLGRPDLLSRVDSILRNTYNFSFQKAHEYQRELAEISPEHPAPYFLEAIIIYWENFPLQPENKSSERFLWLMDRTIELAEDYLEIESLNLEGVFFDLFGRAFKAMFWADNGKSGKVVPDLRMMFKHTKEGFDLKNQFSEFYFSTGLYNYYIEAYPEANPVYKPLVSFMQKGDKKLGLVQLNYAINHTVFLKVESLLFMSLIQLKYENDLNSASIYAERLYMEYPRNLFYQGHLVTVLLYQKRYQKVREILKTLDIQDDPYSSMIKAMADAFIAEKETGNPLRAEKGYQTTLDLADSFGPFANQFKAIAFMGLSRLYESKGLHSESKRYARKAEGLTTYGFILDN